VANISFMDALREIRREYRVQWRAAKGVDQFDEGKRVIAATKANAARDPRTGGPGLLV
jgi:hypothetical protein